MAVHSAIVNGAKQVCDVSNKEMLELMDITDEIRKQIGKATIFQGIQDLIFTFACRIKKPCTAFGAQMLTF